MDKFLKINIYDEKDGFLIETKLEEPLNYLEIGIYNLERIKVKTIFKGKIDVGTHNFFWDKKDDKGNVVEKGIYFLGIKNENDLKVSFKTLIFIM